MPGNEVADKVHNFFDQDNSSQSHQFQVGNGNWPLFGNPWVGTHRQNATPSNLAPRDEFAKGQARNQQVNLNGFIHGNQGLQMKPNQMDFLADNIVPDHHNLTSRGLPFFESQEVNASDIRSPHSRNSERLESVEAPVGFDFLGSQQQLMRGTNPGASQPQPRQQAGIREMPIWQQHFVFKQLQEHQRQQHLQQLNQEVRQQNLLNQMSVFAKQESSNRFPPVVNGLPIHSAQNYLWQNELTGGDPKSSNTSQMSFLSNNINWAQNGGSPAMQGFPNGLLRSQDQGQALHSMGLVPQQQDQSLYGAPVSSSRGSVNQYSPLQGVSQDCTDMMMKSGGNQVEKTMMQSAAFSSYPSDQSAIYPDQVCLDENSSVARQGFQAKNMFGNVPLQGVGSAALPDSLQNSNPLPTNLQFQEFQGIREQSDWQGNLQENNTVPTGLSQSHVDLDPTEEKLLFSADDDNWDASLGRSSNINADGSDILNMFPSIQSGSWSALMQSAVAEASSGDMGLQDEWSGLSFQKIDPAAVIQPTVLNDSGKQQVAWVEDNLQTAVSVTSKPFPLFGDASPSTSGRAGPAYPCEPSDREHTDASHESHSPKHIGMQSNQSLQQRSLGGPTIHNSQQRSFGEASLRAPMHLENTPQNNLARQMYEQSLSTERSAEMESLARQQSIPSSNFSGQSFSKPNGWNINEALSPIAGTTLKGQVNENIDQHAQRYDLQRTMRTEGDPNGTMWRTIDRNRLGVPFPGSPRGLESTKSSFGSPQVQMDDSYKHNLSAFYSKTSEEQQVPNAFHIGHGKRRPVDSSSKHRGNEVMGEYQQLSSKGMQVWKSSVETTDRVSSEEHSKKRDDSSLKEVSHDSNISNRFHPRQGEGTKENSVDSGTGECHLAIGTQNSSGKVGQKSTIHRKFHYHPMGNLGADTEPTEYSKHVTYPQGLPHYGSGAHGSQDQGNSGPSKFASHFVSNGTMDMEMEHSTNMQRNMKAKDSLSRSTTSVYNSGTSGSFSGSATIASPNERTVHASQNMLELLHKVEHSRDGDNASCFDSSDGNPCDALAPVQHHQASVVKGFGLRLGPPSQRLPFSTKDLSSKSAMQTVTDQNTLNMEGGNKDLGRMASLQSLSPSQGISQRDNQDVKLNLAGQTGNGPSYLSSQGHTLTAVSSPYPRNQQQILNVSSPSGQISTDQSANLFVSRGDPNAHAHSAYLRQASEPHSSSGTVTNQPTQVPPPSVASRMSPFRIPSFAESHVSIPTRLHIGNASHSQTQNVWTNVSAQQRLSGMPPHKMSPTVQSISSSSSGLGTVSQASQKKDDEITKKVGDTSSEFGTCFVNSQQVGYGEEQPGRYASLQQVPSEMVDPSSQMTGVRKVQEPGSKQPLDENSVASMSPAVRRYQQDICKGKHVQMPTQMGHVSLQNIASPNHDSVASGHKITLSDVPHLNYSLLEQMQFMKGSEADPNWRLGKRLKEGAHSSNDIQDMAIRAGQRIMYGTGAQQTSFPSDVKMLNFSSEGREDQNATASFQQQGFVASGRNDSQSIPHSLESIERSKISPQMAPSWFEQYGSKNGQILASYQGLGGSQKTAKAAAQQYFFTKVSESMGTQSFAEQRNETDQISRVWQSTPSAVIVHNNLSSHDSQLRNDDTVVAVRPKKRKSAASDLLPWHKKVTGVFQRPQSLSMAEVDWAQAANRRIEKLEDEADIIEDGSLMPRSRRRLILTTQLVQQILPPLSTVILKADAFKEYENVTYSAAKLALGDACCLISHSRSDPRVDPESENTVLVSEKLKSYKRPGDEFLSKVVEGFIGKAKKLEVDLLRLDKRTSLLDIRLECQELEKFSIINRFAKIFNRGNLDGVENPSSSDTHTRKAFPQRYVTALAMPGNLPDGVVCLSL